MLKVFVNDIDLNLALEFTPASQGFSFYISRAQDTIYKSNIERIGLLPTDTIGPVVSAYLAYGALLPQLYGISSRETPISITQFDSVALVELLKAETEPDIRKTVEVMWPVFKHLQVVVTAALDSLQA